MRVLIIIMNNLFQEYENLKLRKGDIKVGQHRYWLDDSIKNVIEVVSVNSKTVTYTYPFSHGILDGIFIRTLEEFIELSSEL